MQGLNKLIKGLVVGRANDLLEGYTEKVRKNVVAAVRDWRMEVKRLLSVPYRGGVNRGLWPMMRSGALRNSVPLYQVTAARTFAGSKLKLGESAITVRRRALHAPWTSYGEVLNEWSTHVEHSTNLDGWKDRAYAKLHEAVSAKFTRISIR